MLLDFSAIKIMSPLLNPFYIGLILFFIADRDQYAKSMESYCHTGICVATD